MLDLIASVVEGKRLGYLEFKESWNNFSFFVDGPFLTSYHSGCKVTIPVA